MRLTSPRTLMTLAASALTILAAAPVSAQDLEGCGDFQRYVDREDYPKALEELTWCRNSIEELHFAKLKAIVSRTVAGYASDGATSESVLGIANVEARYSMGSDRITLNLMGGAAAGSAATSGLGALAGLASAFGVRAEGTRQIRVAGLTGQIEEDGDGVKLTLTMDGGMVLTIEGPDEATAKAFAEDIVPDLEDYLG
jgi:hypothetical protein